MKLINSENTIIPYYTFENLAEAGFPVNAFTTRLLRQNGKLCQSFRPLMRPDSDPDEVNNCIRLMLDQFGTDKSHLVKSAQKHTANIHVVTESFMSRDKKDLECIDGLITNIPGVTLQTLGADCPSVFLADPVHKAIGLCHSGRKGTQQHISAKMLQAMTAKYGTHASDVLAGISPGICVSCYEVGDDVAQDFIDDYLGSTLFADQSIQQHDDNISAGTDLGLLKKSDHKYHIDLNRSISLSLQSAGVPSENIELSDICTKCRSDIFYSFRGDGRIINENCALFRI